MRVSVIEALFVSAFLVMFSENSKKEKENEIKRKTGMVLT